MLPHIFQEKDVSLRSCNSEATVATATAPAVVTGIAMTAWTIQAFGVKQQEISKINGNMLG
jgi:hypothetical protein